jgi:predicted RNA-binding protein associated with RNAse of E/G family
MVATVSHPHRRGEVIALRYLTTDGRIEMCWPCRVVEDNDSLLALFIAAGSAYKAGPKRTALEKRSMPRFALPPDEYLWRHDALRLMFPGRGHSVLLFWDHDDSIRRFSRYFVNMEEPFRRTAVGVDTQDHTLDVDVAPDLSWTWRDTEQLAEHVKHGFYTESLANDVWDEARRAIDDIVRGTHPCLDGWSSWEPDPLWEVPQVPAAWSSVPVILWEKHYWAYGRLGELRREKPLR